MTKEARSKLKELLAEKNNIEAQRKHHLMEAKKLLDFKRKHGLTYKGIAQKTGIAENTVFLFNSGEYSL